VLCEHGHLILGFYFSFQTFFEVFQEVDFCRTHEPVPTGPPGSDLAAKPSSWSVSAVLGSMPHRDGGPVVPSSQIYLGGRTMTQGPPRGRTAQRSQPDLQIFLLFLLLLLALSLFSPVDAASDISTVTFGRSKPNRWRNVRLNTLQWRER